MRNTTVIAVMALSSALAMSVASAQDLMMDSLRSQDMSPESISTRKLNVLTGPTESLKDLALSSKYTSEATGAKPTTGLLNSLSRSTGQAAQGSGEFGNATLSSQKSDLAADLKTPMLLGMEQSATFQQDIRDLPVAQKHLLGR